MCWLTMGGSMTELPAGAAAQRGLRPIPTGEGEQGQPCFNCRIKRTEGPLDAPSALHYLPTPQNHGNHHLAPRA